MKKLNKNLLIMTTEYSEKAYLENTLKFALERFGDKPDYPWAKYPEYAVLRHACNKKWYAVFMTVSKTKLSLQESGCLDIMNIKSDPSVVLALLAAKGFLPAYHMNRRHWVTVLLDGAVSTKELFPLLERSHELTGGHG